MLSETSQAQTDKCTKRMCNSLSYVVIEGEENGSYQGLEWLQVRRAGMILIREYTITDRGNKFQEIYFMTRLLY
jgi:hypothetical protein